MKLMKHQHSTLNMRVCVTFIQYVPYFIKWFVVAVVVVVRYRFFRMLPKKLVMKLHKKSDKESGSSLFGVLHFLSIVIVKNLRKWIKANYTDN